MGILISVNGYNAGEKFAITKFINFCITDMKMSKFEKVESLENWVAWQYLRNELGWTVAKIAYELDVNERKLLEWVNISASEMTRIADKQPGKVKEILGRLKKKHPISKPEDREMPKIDLKKALDLHDDGYKLPEIAQKLKVKYDDFILFWTQNLSLINAEVKKRSVARNVITQ